MIPSDDGMQTSLFIGWTTINSEEAATKLAREIVEQRLASCVQIDQPVQSIYQWKGLVQSEREWRLMVKFVASNSDSLRSYIIANHPYDVPEWIVVRIDHGAPDYLKWMLE